MQKTPVFCIMHVPGWSRIKKGGVICETTGTNTTVD
nr:MAG TPA: hypothetical protein [Caudoviricetes sp.]